MDPRLNIFSEMCCHGSNARSNASANDYFGRKGLVLATWHAHKYRIYAASIMADAEVSVKSEKIRFAAKLYLIIS